MSNYNLQASSRSKIVIGSIRETDWKFELTIDEYDGHMHPLSGHAYTCVAYDTLYESLQAFLDRVDGLSNVTMTDMMGRKIDFDELLYGFKVDQEIC